MFMVLVKKQARHLKKILAGLLAVIMVIGFMPQQNVYASTAIEISTAQQFNTLVRNNNRGNFVLTADINLASVITANNGWNPFDFRGTLDGNGHTISGLWGNRSSEQGLFADLRDGATIRNLNVELGGNIIGSTRIGILAGRARHGERVVIDNVHVNGNNHRLEASNLLGYVGGLVGYVGDGTVIRDSSVSNVRVNTRTTSNYSGGITGAARNATLTNVRVYNAHMTGHSYVGGIAGVVYGGTGTRVTYGYVDSYSSVWARQSFAGGGFGAIYNNAQVQRTIVHAGVGTGNNYPGGFAGVIYNGGNVSASAAYGNVNGNRAAGGFVGRIYDRGRITNAYARGNVNGTHEVGGFIGRFSGNARVFNAYATGRVHASRGTAVAAFTGYHLNNNSGIYAGRNFANSDTANSPWVIGTTSIGSIENTGARPVFRTSEQMLYQPTFIDWNFDTIWVMTDDFPKFQFSHGSGTIPANTLLTVMVVNEDDEYSQLIEDSQVFVRYPWASVGMYLLNVGVGTFEFEISGMYDEESMYFTASADGFTDTVVLYYGSELLQLAADGISLIIPLQSVTASSITIVEYVEEIERGGSFTFEAEAVNAGNVRWEILDAYDYTSIYNSDYASINPTTGQLTLSVYAPVGYTFIVRAYSDEDASVNDIRFVEVVDIYRYVTWEWESEEGPQSETERVPGSGGSNNPITPPTTNPHPPTGTGPGGSDRDYDFDGWAPEGDRDNIWDLDNPPAGDDDVILRPVFTPLFTVVFNTDGGSYVPSQQVRQGELVIRPVDPTRDGYTFAGWYFVSPGWTSPWNFYVNRINADNTITATWELEAAEIFTITATPTDPDFGSHQAGYIQRPTQTITVTNTGNQPIILNSLPNVNGWTLEPVGGDWYTEIAPEATRQFTIRPNNGLSVGNHNTSFDITGNDGAYVTIVATFTVTPAAQQVFLQAGVMGAPLADRPNVVAGDLVAVTTRVYNPAWLNSHAAENVVIQLQRVDFLNYSDIPLFEGAFLVDVTENHVFIGLTQTLSPGQYTFVTFFVPATQARPAGTSFGTATVSGTAVN